MITETGIVTDVNPSFAWVKTTRSSACKSCSSRESCDTAGDQQEMTVMVKNTLNVEKGDTVLIGLESRHVLYLTFLLYVFPIILLVTGALIGNSLAPFFNMNPSLISMFSGSLFFGLAFYIIRRKNNSLSKKEEYKPFLVKKKSQVIPASCSML
ncbi:MAG: SoxR reducing system RseC family protein [Deltaproteobacteria bacterium]|nr:SoxR reducing system RseC family protein [Deltaproteobacteria bacterium]